MDSVTAGYIVIFLAPNLHLLSFHLFTLCLTCLLPPTPYRSLRIYKPFFVTSFTFLKPVSLHKCFSVRFVFSVYSCVSPFIRPR